MTENSNSHDDNGAGQIAMTDDLFGLWALSGSHGYHHDRLGVASVLIQDGFAEVLTRRGISVFGERRR
jgi:hypothetical protein